MVGREEQPGRVRPAWWGLTRSRSVSVPRSRGDVISGGSRVVFFLPRSFSSSLAPIASSPSSFLLLTRFNDNAISLRAFPAVATVSLWQLRCNWNFFYDPSCILRCSLMCLYWSIFYIVSWLFPVRGVARTKCEGGSDIFHILTFSIVCDRLYRQSESWLKVRKCIEEMWQWSNL